MTFNRDDLVFPKALFLGFGSAQMRAKCELVLIFARDLVHARKKLGRQTHAARAFSHDMVHRWIEIHSVSHRHVAHVLDAANEIHIAEAGNDVGCRGMKRGHRRAAEAIDRLGAHAFWKTCEKRREPSDVVALLEGLLHAAPDHVVDLFWIELGIAFHQRAHQMSRKLFRANVTIHSAFRAAHRGTDGINYNGFAIHA